MPRAHHLEPFYLIITGRDNGTFSVEGPMTDDRSWNHAVVVAPKSGRQIRCSTARGFSAEDTTDMATLGMATTGLPTMDTATHLFTTEAATTDTATDARDADPPISCP